MNAMTNAGEGRSVFWALVRHELKIKGSWKKRNRSTVAKWWWFVYLFVLVLGGLGTAAYFAARGNLRLETLWFATYGLPYFIFFLGFGDIRREADNGTQDWWLTLPYPRHWLIGAKCVAAWLKAAALVVGCLTLAILYGVALAALLPNYGMRDVGSFLAAGINWLLLGFGFSPFIVAGGLFTSTVMLTKLRPLFPILMTVFMAAGGLFYSSESIARQFSGELPAAFFPYPPSVIAAMPAGWIAAYALIRLAGRWLDRHLQI